MTNAASISGYAYKSSVASHSDAYLLPVVRNVLDHHFALSSNGPRRVFDLGCGNGAGAAYLDKCGYVVDGVDPSPTGIAQARARLPHLRLDVGSAYDPLAETYGQYPTTISLEVIEHVYAPRDFSRTLFNLTAPGGLAVISTPYHSYLKNLTLAVTGKLDQHFTALWDHGHIKFWSVRTLTQLLHETGFQVDQVIRVGRFAPLAKSMIVVARRPQ